MLTFVDIGKGAPRPVGAREDGAGTTTFNNKRSPRAGQQRPGQMSTNENIAAPEKASAGFGMLYHRFDLRSVRAKVFSYDFHVARVIKPPPLSITPKVAR